MRKHKGIWRVRRRIQMREQTATSDFAIVQKRPLPRPRRAVTLPFFATSSGRNIFDNIGMARRMHEFFSNLCCDDSPLIPGALPEWIYKRWNSEVLAGYREITGYFIKEVAFSFSKGKVGSSDRIVIEMIKELDEVILQELAAVFKPRV